MALDFYEINDTRQKDKLFSIDNKQVDLMDDIFLEFKSLQETMLTLMVQTEFIRSMLN